MLRWENVLERHELFSFGWQPANGKRPRISYDRRVNQALGLSWPDRLAGFLFVAAPNFMQPMFEKPPEAP